jgi:hypothetical protein
MNREVIRALARLFILSNPFCIIRHIRFTARQPGGEPPRPLLSNTWVEIIVVFLTVRFIMKPFLRHTHAGGWSIFSATNEGAFYQAGSSQSTYPSEMLN